MRIIGPFVIGLAIAMSSLSSTEASAAVICNGCDYTAGPAEYLGVYNPLAEDQATYVHNNITGAFSDAYVFDTTANGFGFLSATFNPLANVSGFTMSLYNVVTATTVCGAINNPCTSLTLSGGPIATNMGAGFVFIQNQPLTAARYAFVLSGTASGVGTESYAGNLTVRATPTTVPDGGSTAALLGSVLVGFGLLRRKISNI